MEAETFFEAIGRGDAATVADMLDENPSLSNSRHKQISPILFAVYNGHAEVVRCFVERNAVLSFSELCALGEQDRAIQMLDDEPALLNSFSEDGFPALGLAVFFRHAGLARALIERGADVNAAARNDARVSPIHAAAAVRDAGTMRLLLARGAGVDARQQRGYTALHTAAQLGDASMVEILLQAGAGAHVRSDDGKSPADLAAAHGHAELAERLA